MTRRTPDQGKKRFTPVRPLLNQPPLNIENLPTRIQNGECTVLPPKFCSPMCPPTACPPPCNPCQPPPCTTFCIPRSPCIPSCCYPNPCSPCTPVPSPMCCPPPCPPVFMCAPPCTPCPFPCTPCTPCMPSPPPPPCCPPPPCPPPPCQPCVPQSGCCGSGNSCCCSSPKQIVCIPKRAQAMMGACGNNGNQSGRAPAAKTGCGGGVPGIKHGLSDQPASYNNCNFYLSEIPKSLRDKFGMSSSGEKENQEWDECADDQNNWRGEENCEDDLVNVTAGDNQIVHPPVGYPGSQRSPWGAGAGGYSGLNDDLAGAGNSYGIGKGGANGKGGKGRGYYGDVNETGDPGSRGYYGDVNGTGDPESRGYNDVSGGTGESGKGRYSGENSQRQSGSSGGRNSGNGRTGNKVRISGTTSGGRATTGGGTTTTGGRSRNNTSLKKGGANDPYGRSQSRYGTAADDYKNPTRHGTGGRINNGLNARSNYSTAKTCNSSYYNKSGAASREIIRALSGSRPYSYSNAELTQKSDAYLPEKYDVPPPHTVDSSIHPSRAPITPYATYNNPDDDEPSIYNYGKSVGTSKSAQKRDFGNMTSSNTRSQATMKPSSSSVRSTRNANTSTYRTDTSGKSTAVQSSRLNHSTAAGSTAPSPSPHHANTSTSRTNASSKSTAVQLSRLNHSTAVGSTAPSTYHANTNTSRYESLDNSTDSPASHYTTVDSSAFPSTNHTHTSTHQDASTKSTATPGGFPASNRTNSTAPSKFNGSQPTSNRTVTKYRNAGATGSQSEPNLTSLRSLREEEEDVEPDYEVSGNEGMESEPVSQQDSRANFGGDDFDNRNKSHKKPTNDDPCNIPRSCLKYHTKRLHRLCSFSNRRAKRLSAIHKPMFHFKTPPCPIRETNASILRKVPPNSCKWHDNHMPAFHEFCMTDRHPDTNRYPMLTQEFSPLRHEYESISNAPSRGQVERRGAKRKNHHR